LGSLSVCIAILVSTLGGDQNQHVTGFSAKQVYEKEKEDKSKLAKENKGEG